MLSSPTSEHLSLEPTLQRLHETVSVLVGSVMLWGTIFFLKSVIRIEVLLLF